MLTTTLLISAFVTKQIIAETWEIVEENPDSCKSEIFIKQHFNTSMHEPFPLHPDFYNQQAIIEMQKHLKASQDEKFRQVEIDYFITNCSANSVINVIENKVKTQIYIQALNHKYPQLQIKMMNRCLIITETQWKHHRINSDWIKTTLSGIQKDLIQGKEFVMKPSYGSRSMGKTLLHEPCSTEELIKNIDDIFSGVKSTEQGTPIPDPKFKAIIVEEMYLWDMVQMPTEIRLWFVFGKFYHGTIDYLDVTFTFDHHCIYSRTRDRELCEKLETLLSAEELEYMVKRGELIAKDSGLYLMRTDWFKGSNQSGIVLNELAYPNHIALCGYEGSLQAMHKRQIIGHGLNHGLGQIYNIRNRNDDRFVIDTLDFHGIDINTQNDADKVVSH